MGPCSKNASTSPKSARDGHDHEPEPDDDRRPTISVVGLHERHQPRPPTRYTPLHPGVHGDSRRRSSFPRLCTEQPDLAAIATRFLPPSLGPSHHLSSSAPTLLDQRLGSFPCLQNHTPVEPRHLVGRTRTVGGRPPGFPWLVLAIHSRPSGLNVRDPPPHSRQHVWTPGGTQCRTATFLCSPEHPFGRTSLRLPVGPARQHTLTTRRPHPGTMRRWFGSQPSRS